MGLLSPIRSAGRADLDLQVFSKLVVISKCCSCSRWAYQKLVERILDQEVGMTRYYTYVVTKPIKLQPAPPLFVLEPIIKESSAT